MNNKMKLIKIITNKPLFFGLLYVSMIPIFAFIYSFLLTNDFYHSTISKEYNFLITEEIKLNEGLENQFIQTYIKNNLDKDSLIKINKLTIIDTDYSNNFLTGKIQILYKWKGLEYLVNIPFDLSTNIVYYDDKLDKYALIIRFNDIDKMPLINLIFKDNIYYSSNSKTIKIDKKLYNLIFNYVKAKQGISTNIEGNFSRMFYLSAMTVTTVGYGDIVPLTNRARITVSIEAILGIVIIGLFLNSISNKIVKAGNTVYK